MGNVRDDRDRVRSFVKIRSARGNSAFNSLYEERDDVTRVRRGRGSYSRVTFRDEGKGREMFRSRVKFAGRVAIKRSSFRNQFVTRPRDRPRNYKKECVRSGKRRGLAVADFESIFFLFREGEDLIKKRKEKRNRQNGTVFRGARLGSSRFKGVLVTYCKVSPTVLSCVVQCFLSI